MKTKQSIKDFYKHADLNDISENVVKAFEVVIREDESKDIMNKIENMFKDENTYSGLIIKWEIKNRLGI